MKKDMSALCALAASDPKATADIKANAHTRGASDFADISSSRLIRAFSNDVDTGSREESASNRKLEPPFRCNRDEMGPGVFATSHQHATAYIIPRDSAGRNYNESRGGKRRRAEPRRLFIVLSRGISWSAGSPTVRSRDRAAARRSRPR